MLPDSSWINALKLPTQVIIGLFLAFLVLLGLDWAAVLTLATFGELTKPIVIVLLVISGSLSITGIGAYIKDQLERHKSHSLVAMRKQLRAQEKESERTKAQGAALERIEHLSPKELRYLANCLREGSQSFYTYVHSPPVTTLMGKGLVYTPGGTHHQDHYPFTIYDFIWKALIERRDEILAKDSANKKKEDEEKRRNRY